MPSQGLTYMLNKRKTERDGDDDDDDCGIMALFTGISRRSDSVPAKKAIIWKGEMVHWGSGLISVKDRAGGCRRQIQ